MCLFDYVYGFVLVCAVFYHFLLTYWCGSASIDRINTIHLPSIFQSDSSFIFVSDQPQHVCVFGLNWSGTGVNHNVRGYSRQLCFLLPRRFQAVEYSISTSHHGGLNQVYSSMIPSSFFTNLTRQNNLLLCFATLILTFLMSNIPPRS